MLAGLPRGKIMGKEPPGTATTDHREDRLQKSAPAPGTGAPTPRERGPQGGEDGSLLLGPSASIRVVVHTRGAYRFSSLQALFRQPLTDSNGI
jgi:hypothetical protein